MTTHEYLLQKYGTTLTFHEASKEIGVYWQTIRNMCLRADIKTVRAGYKWVLTTKALAEYLDNKENKEHDNLGTTRKGYKKSCRFLQINSRVLFIGICINFLC